MKRAVVLGASSGIGQELARLLQKDNWDVFTIARTGNVSQNLDIHRIGAIKTMKDIDLVVNCVGILDFDEDKVLAIAQHVFDVNFWGAAKAMHYFKDKLVYNGLFINITSLAALKPDFDIKYYSASKSALESLTKAYAKEFAHKTRWNTIAPGFVAFTRLVDSPIPKEMIESLPIPRAMEPHEIYEAVKYLYHSTYVTGQTIVMDGGAMI